MGVSESLKRGSVELLILELLRKYKNVDTEALLRKLKDIK